MSVDTLDWTLFTSLSSFHPLICFLDPQEANKQHHRSPLHTTTAAISPCKFKIPPSVDFLNYPSCEGHKLRLFVFFHILYLLPFFFRFLLQLIIATAEIPFGATLPSPLSHSDLTSAKPWFLSKLTHTGQHLL